MDSSTIYAFMRSSRALILSKCTCSRRDWPALQHKSTQTARKTSTRDSSIWPITQSTRRTKTISRIRERTEASRQSRTKMVRMHRNGTLHSWKTTSKKLVLTSRQSCIASRTSLSKLCSQLSLTLSQLCLVALSTEMCASSCMVSISCLTLSWSHGSSRWTSRHHWAAPAPSIKRSKRCWYVTHLTS